MDFEQWAKGDSVFHRSSPQLKIVGAVLFCFSLAACQQLQAVLFGLAFASFWVLFARIPKRSLTKRLLFVNIFTLVCWLTIPVTVQGTSVGQVGFISISREGIDLALLITIKTNGMVLAFIALIGTSSIAEIGHGLSRLKVPSKLCLLLLFSYRYIFVIHDEYKRLKRAAIFRSFRPTTSMHTYQTYGNLLGMTLVKGWRRAGRVQDAMSLRGFAGEFIALNYTRVRSSDWLLLAIVVCCTGLVLVCEYSGVVV